MANGRRGGSAAAVDSQVEVNHFIGSFAVCQARRRALRPAAGQMLRLDGV